MRYDVATGELKMPLRYAVQRFVQILRRRGYKLEFKRVVEPNTRGVKNHANLVFAFDGAAPDNHYLKGVWMKATEGSSFEVASAPVKDVGQLSRYLAKYLSGYLAKTLDSPGGLDSNVHNATRKRVETYVSESRGWLPVGSEKEWKRLFVENAVIWTCTRGFFHTDLRDTSVKWYAWLMRQSVRWDHGERAQISL